MLISKLTAYVPAKPGTQPATRALPLANALFAELVNYGIVMDRELHQRIASLPDEPLALQVVRDILDRLTAGADVELNRPLFANWEDRKYMTVSDCIIQICGYVFQFDGNMLNDPTFTDAIHNNVAYDKVKVLRLASEEEFEQYFNSLVNANTALDRDHTKRLEYVFSLCADRLDKLPHIRSAEIRVTAMMELALSRPLDQVLRVLRCQPVDVLRFAAALKSFESLKLPADVVYSNLSWQQRKAALEFWNTCDFQELSEAMGQNRTAWTRFFDHIHMFQQEQFQRYPTAWLAAAVSVGSRSDFIPTKLRKQLNGMIQSGIVEVTEAGTLAYRTFASRVASAVKSEDTKSLLALVDQRPGWAFRNLGTILGGVPHRLASSFADSLAEYLPRIQPAILFAILGINPDAQWRVIEAKGKTRIEPADYGPVFSYLRDRIIVHLKTRYGYAGRVEVDAELRDRVVPFISRNSELDRGSANVVDVSKSYLYLFQHWIQGQQRTDLDMSLVAFDKDWKETTVWFGSQAGNWMRMSGDFTSAPAPNGATEYGRIDLDKIPSHIRYVMPAFNVYAGDNFGKCKVCRAGFMASNSNRFELTQDATYYDVTSKEARLHVPFVYDVRANKIITLNYNQEQGGYGTSIHSYLDDLKKLIAASDAANPVTIAELGEWLSGDGQETGLRITETPDPDNKSEIAPDRLFTLFEK